MACSLTVWLLAQLAGVPMIAEILLWPGTVLAVFSAVYTAFLFAQAKGRDFWQNPLLSLHLLAHALLAGGAAWLLTEAAQHEVSQIARLFTVGTLIFSLVALMAEVMTVAPTTDARMALDWIIGRPMGGWFWGAGIGVGHVLPLALLATGSSAAAAAGAVAALAGMLVIERLWVKAPQLVPLS